MQVDRDIDLGRPTLTIDDIDAVARHAAHVGVSTAARARLEQSHAFVQELARANVPVYGLTTGCGPLASQPVPAERRPQFQRNLIRSHATTLGVPQPASFVRAAMLLRAHVLAFGYSGVDPATVDVLTAMLNHRIHPIVRSVGSVGASGDLVELAQIALTVIGEGTAIVDGREVPAADALRAVGVEPLVPQLREGLALMNGTCFHSGAAALLLRRSQCISDAALIAAAMGFEALHGNLEALDPALQHVRPHPGQRTVATQMARLVAGSALLRNGQSAHSQDAYTLRCIPQVMGAVLDALDAVRTVIEIEINSVTDNPLFLPDDGRVVHGGNFHGQPVAMALDQLKAAMVELGVVSERRLARLLDATLNAGLPPFLIHDSGSTAGLRSGFMGLQYCASTMAADNAVLAAPTSVRSVPTNANNQDVVSMGVVAARHAAQVIDNLERMAAIELLCAAQALDLRGSVHAGIGTRAAHALIRQRIDPLIEDRPLRNDVESACALIDSGTLVDAVRAAGAWIAAPDTSS